MSKVQLASIAFVFLIGLILRLHNYEIYPQRGASSDEYAYSFLGVSMLTKGVPTAWSAFNVYKNRRDLTIENLYFPIVYPYFDHPPLNGLLVGGFALLFGQDRFEEIDLKTVRLVPIGLWVVSALLMFLLGRRLYGYRTALWALLIYSTVTIFAMNQRMVFAENLLTPLFLISLYIFLVFRKHLTYSKAALLGILSGLSFWAKESGIVVFIVMIFLFILDNVRPRVVVTLAAVSIFFILLYVAYGMYYDGELFWKVISIQSERHIGPQTLLLLTATPIIVNKVYFDGWYFFGFISLFISLLDYKKHQIVLVSSVLYLLFLLFTLTQEERLGWYMIPMFPFMALLSASVLSQGLSKQSWTVFLLLLFVGLSQVKFFYEDNFGLVPTQFRILMFLLFGPLFILLCLKNDVWFERLARIWFYLLILGNIILTYTYVHPA